MIVTLDYRTARTSVITIENMCFKIKFEAIWRNNEQYMTAYRNHREGPYTKLMKGQNGKYRK